MNALLKILGDRGFWTSATTLLTFVLTRAFHLSGEDAALIVGSVAGMSMTIDAILAGSPKTTDPTPPERSEPMKTLLVALLAIATVALLVGCPAITPGTASTTAPGLDVPSLVTLALTDYEALVASGIVKETPELDAAITAVTKAQQDYAAGKGTVYAVNDAGIALAIALGHARNGK